MQMYILLKNSSYSESIKIIQHIQSPYTLWSF